MSRDHDAPRLELARQAAPFGVWEYDAERGTLLCDAPLRALLGLDDEVDPAPTVLGDIVHPDDLPAVRTAIHSALVPDSPAVSLLCRMVRPRSKEIVRIASRGGRVAGAGAPRLAGIALPLDIEPALEELFGGEEFVPALLDERKGSARGRDPRQRYTFVNEHCRRCTDPNREQCFAKRPAAPGPEPSATRPLRDDQVPIAGAGPHDPPKVDIGAPTHAELARHAALLQLDGLFDNDRTLAWVIDDRGRFHYMSSRVRAHFGVDPSAVQATTLDHLRRADAVQIHRGRVSCVLRRQWTLQFIDEVADPDGRCRWWLNLEFPIAHAPHGLRVGCVAIDITEQTEWRQARDEFRMLFRQVQSGHEEERKRIARDLHDVLGGTLAVVKSQLALIDSATVRADPERVDAMTARLRALIDGLLLDADRLVTWLRPPSLDHLGLGAALEQLAREFHALHGVACTVEQATPLPALSEAQNVMLYRILQEGLGNVGKHARAQRARITLRVQGRRLVVTLDDDGRGMAHEPGDRRGFGLLGMRERARLLGGRLELGNGPLGGAHLRVSIPLHD